MQIKDIGKEIVIDITKRTINKWWKNVFPRDTTIPLAVSIWTEDTRMIKWSSDIGSGSASNIYNLRSSIRQGIELKCDLMKKYTVVLFPLPALYKNYGKVEMQKMIKEDWCGSTTAPSGEEIIKYISTKDILKGVLYATTRSFSKILRLG